MGRTRRDIIADNMRIALSRPEQPWRCAVCGTAARAKTDLTYERELKEVKIKFEQLGRKFVELERQYQEDTARLRAAVLAATSVAVDLIEAEEAARLAAAAAGTVFLIATDNTPASKED